MNTERLKLILKAEEGLRLTVYDDSVGVPTIGHGRNLQDPGISEAEADLLFENDLAGAIARASKLFVGFAELSDVRQEVLVNMAFNLGGRLARFTNTREAVELKDFDRAADEILDSKAARQLPSRYERLSEAMRGDAWT